MGSVPVSGLGQVKGIHLISFMLLKEFTFS